MMMPRTFIELEAVQEIPKGVNIVKPAISSGFLFCLLLMAACDPSASKLQGKYVNPQNPGEYLELKSDKTFFLSQRNGQFTGKWKLDGSELLLESGYGASKCRVDENKIFNVFIIPMVEKQ